MKQGKIVGAGLAALAGFVGIVLLLTAQAVPGKLPGLVSADPFGKGCVDCHKVQTDGKDLRVSAVLKGVKNHPNITSIVKNLPTDCTMCHKAGTTAKELNIVLHKVHYELKADSAFVKSYGGECLNCHLFDATTFEMKVKSAPKNW